MGFRFRGFRFRIGPFTFGRSGVRLSFWRRGFGFSVPVSGRGESFGKMRLGPFRWFFNNREDEVEGERHKGLGPYEEAAIKIVESDQQFLGRLCEHGMPWRGIQERLKEALPNQLRDRDHIAYGLVPKAMNVLFGEQETVWKTEKRPSKSGKGHTTWIVVIDPKS